MVASSPPYSVEPREALLLVQRLDARYRLRVIWSVPPPQSGRCFVSSSPPRPATPFGDASIVPTVGAGRALRHGCDRPRVPGSGPAESLKQDRHAPAGPVETPCRRVTALQIGTSPVGRAEGGCPWILADIGGFGT